MKTAKLRCDSKTWEALSRILFAGYPKREAASFLKCGWADGRDGLVLTIHSLVLPDDNETECEDGRVGLNEPYTLRSAFELEKGKFALGLVHSHPQNSGVYPSLTDDDMDEYYSRYFGGFLKDRPYLSFIVSRSREGELAFSGRVFHHGAWLFCSQLQITGERNEQIFAQNLRAGELPEKIARRLERFSGILGKESALRMWRTRVGIIGAGGTGSALFHSLIRSCVGSIVVVDPDVISDSNSERVHGFKDGDVELGLSKVAIMARLGREVNPLVEVVPIAKDALDPGSLAALIECDFIVGCTDSEVGRLLVSDLANRFLIPAVHVNVSMETNLQTRKLDAQIVHITQYGPNLACANCRGQIDSQKLTQQLLTPEERSLRKQRQQERPDVPGAYWKDEPVLHTVGCLTTIASEMVALRLTALISGCEIEVPGFLENDLMDAGAGAVIVPMLARVDCSCRVEKGVAFQQDAWFLPRRPNAKIVVNENPPSCENVILEET